jgi:hypothetical protein
MQSKLRLILIGFAASAALAACDEAPTMSVLPSSPAVGEDIVVSFSTPIRGQASDLYWIALQSVDSPDSRGAGRILVEHGQTKARIRAAESGSMEVRLHDRYPQNESHIVARAPVRVLAARDIAPVPPPVAGTPLTETECLNQWLVTKNLDAYGSPEGSVYRNVSPLFDPSSQRMTPRTTYLYAKLPDSKLACARAPQPASDVRESSSSPP